MPRISRDYKEVTKLYIRNREISQRERKWLFQILRMYIMGANDTEINQGRKDIFLEHQIEEGIFCDIFAEVLGY